MPPEDRTEPGRPSRIMRGEVSSPVAGGLRMIGSHGHDRAEASGELMPPLDDAGVPVDPQRELVTIMPRRTTREVPAVEPPPPAERFASAAAAAGRVGLRRRRRAARRPGPGPLVMVLVALGSLLLGMSAFMFLRKKHAPSVELDGGVTTPIAMTAVAGDADPYTATLDASPRRSRAATPESSRSIASAQRVAVSPVDARPGIDAPVVAPVVDPQRPAAASARVTRASARGARGRRSDAGARARRGIAEAAQDRADVSRASARVTTARSNRRRARVRRRRDGDREQLSSRRGKSAA